LGLAGAIDRELHLLKRHLPYFESDHVLNLTYNVLAGGQCLQDLELLRTDENCLDSLGAQRIPDPTTAGDFLRRFGSQDIDTLMRVINQKRVQVWQRQPAAFLEQAIIEADGTLVGTTGECKQGMDLSYNGVWGYHPLIVSLANTQEPLFIVNRPASRPSYEGAAEYFDRAAALCREAGFRHISFRGDTDFTQAAHLDPRGCGLLARSVREIVSGFKITRPEAELFVRPAPGGLSREAARGLMTPPRQTHRSRCTVCRGSGLDRFLNRRYTAGGRDDRSCPRCLGECYVDIAEREESPGSEEAAAKRKAE
jgi:hypothetical protein